MASATDVITDATLTWSFYLWDTNERRWRPEIETQGDREWAQVREMRSSISKSNKMISIVDFNVRRTCSAFYVSASIRMRELVVAIAAPP